MLCPPGSGSLLLMMKSSCVKLLGELRNGQAKSLERPSHALTVYEHRPAAGYFVCLAMQMKMLYEHADCEQHLPLPMCVLPC